MMSDRLVPGVKGYIRDSRGGWLACHRGLVIAPPSPREPEPRGGWDGAGGDTR